MTLTREQKKEKCLKYATLKSQVKGLEAEIDELGGEVLMIITEEAPKDLTISTDQGIFTVANKRRWTYPKEIVAIEKDLKEKKTEAEAKGIATCVENPYLLFKAKKDE